MGAGLGGVGAQVGRVERSVNRAPPCLVGVLAEVGMAGAGPVLESREGSWGAASVGAAEVGSEHRELQGQLSWAAHPAWASCPSPGFPAASTASQNLGRWVGRRSPA